MLSGPAKDTFEARAECQANKLTPDQGKEAHSLKQVTYFAPWFPREILSKNISHL